ncbi:MAG: hypothetical protein HY619_04160 [Thaumarchaeota archaeon]|nr:hypothetical protein [Nitrososphaerota archaeon]
MHVERADHNRKGVDGLNITKSQNLVGVLRYAIWLTAGILLLIPVFPVMTPTRGVCQTSGPKLTILVDVYLVNSNTPNQITPETRDKMIQETNRIWERFGIDLTVTNTSNVQASEDLARVGRLTGKLANDAEALGELTGKRFHDSKLDIFLIERFEDSTLAGYGLLSGGKKIGALFVSVRDFNAYVTAHELGHSLGLGHVMARNLMIDDGPYHMRVMRDILHPTNLDETQVDIARGTVKGRFLYLESQTTRTRC